MITTNNIPRARPAKPMAAKLKNAGSQNWCGPVAISVLTGRTTGYIQKLVAEHRNRYSQRRTSPARVMGMQNPEFRIILNKLGFEMIPLPTPEKNITLGTYMKERGGPAWRANCLIFVSEHALVANCDQLFDSLRVDGEHYSEHPSRKRWFEAAFLVRRKTKKR